MKLAWKVLWLVLIGICFFLPAVDTDLGWHLRYGREIWENHRIFQKNELGFYLDDYRWEHGYSLYQVLVYVVYKYLGFWGLSVTGSLLVVGIFYFMIEDKEPAWWKYLLILGYFWLVSKPVMGLGLRSQLFSLLGVAAVILLVRRQKWKWTPVVMLLWVNLHGGFVVGLLVLAAATVEKILLREGKEARAVGLVLVLSWLASLINPFGINIYKEVWRHSWYPLNQLIVEWTGPNNLGILMIMVSAAASLGVIVIKRKMDFVFIVWLIFVAMAGGARRNLGLLGVGTVTLGLGSWKAGKAEIKRWQLGVLVVLIVATGGWKAWRLAGVKNDWSVPCRFSEWPLPCRAVEYIKSERPSCRNIFNAYEWGGFLEWQLPEYKYFVDGRMPTWETPEGKSPYTIYLEILHAPPGYQEKLDGYKADCLLIEKGRLLDVELRKGKNNNWQMNYEDEVAVLYVRKG